MKKIFAYLLTAVMLFTMVSCGEGTYVYTESEVIQKNLKVESYEWTRFVSPDMPGYYSATFDVPELNSYNYETAMVTCEIYLGDARQPLPYSTHYKNEIGHQWTRTVDYQYSQGKISFYVTASDYEEDVPETMRFRLSILCEE